jgi:hypothetical protein
VELKKRHDAKARELTMRGVVYRDNQRFFPDFQDYHRRFCEYQQSKRLLRLDAQVQRYRATQWAGLRGIRNFLNPLADNFTMSRFVAGLLLGSAVPLLVTLRSGVLTEWLVQRTHWATAPANLGMLILAYVAAGAAVGSLFRQKSFIWSLLLGYLPARLFGLHSSISVLLCLWMAVCADLVSRWKMQRQRLV